MNNNITIINNDDYASIFYINENSEEKYLYEYFILPPSCGNVTDKLNILDTYQKNLNDFFARKDYFNYSLQFINLPLPYGLAKINDETILTENYELEIQDDEEKIFYFKPNNSLVDEVSIIYNISQKTYSSICEIKLNILKISPCYHSCEICSVSEDKSSEVNHNCLVCKENYYPHLEEPNNCYNKEEASKYSRWNFDDINKVLYSCILLCKTCSGPNENNCLSCYKDNNPFIYLDNGLCTANCSSGYYPKLINESSNYYYKCEKCYINCKTCFAEGNKDIMNCETCEDNQIKNRTNCYNISNNKILTFYEPEDKIENSCFQKFGLYIKEDSKECIPLPEESEGYFISNKKTGLLSKCHDNCLLCENGPINDESGYLESMECLKCKNFDNSEKRIIKLYNNCFPILKYEEKEIIFDVSEIKRDVIQGNCKEFGKAIYYEKYECIDKPENTYYVLNNGTNTGIIKDCHKFCSKCYGEGSSLDTNCVECAQGYVKTEDSNTNCLKNDSIPENYYKNETDGIYYKCYDNCKKCNRKYDLNTQNMHCLECKDNYFFVFGENNCFDNETILSTKKYYFNISDSKFHKCYHSCLNCSNFEPNETNHFCESCTEGYFFLKNTSNCYNITLQETGYYLDYDDNYVFKKCYKSCKICTGNIIYDNTLNKENHSCIECADNYYKLDNDLYPQNCYDNETINNLKKTTINLNEFNEEEEENENEEDENNFLTKKELKQGEEEKEKEKNIEDKRRGRKRKRKKHGRGRKGKRKI